MRLEELKETLAEASQVFVLTDANVAMYWLPELEHWLGCEHAVEIVVKAGERYKTLGTVQRIWKALLKHNADRNAVLVNLGGGTVTDMGGFAASCYQRGIRFVNVPTTLLAMVDASIGGKNGVDFVGCKNQIGTFAEPIEVMVNPIFLSTLPDRELLSGIAEMVKYGFVADEDLLDVSEDNYEQYILRAGEIKKDIVEQDYRDLGKRHVLNFGHTIGHALEAYSLTTETPLTHGEAVALGMWCALWLSVQLCDLNESALIDYEQRLPSLLSEAEVNLGIGDIEAIMSYLDHDKKNRDGQTSFVLLKAVEKPVLDQHVTESLVTEALLEMMKLVRTL
ncbi:MAG: 3-dehydroquinate synthase [Bacteroidales bacterium]|nr:3-dehydroquinate synthase [Bacteroidales bacterium]